MRCICTRFLARAGISRIVSRITPTAHANRVPNSVPYFKTVPRRTVLYSTVRCRTVPPQVFSKVEANGKSVIYSITTIAELFFGGEHNDGSENAEEMLSSGEWVLVLRHL